LVWQDKQLDLALVRFSENDAPLGELSPVLWARLPLGEKVDCRAIGFPSFADSSTDTRKLNIEAVIDPDTGKGPPEIALKIKSGQPLPRDPSGGWKGYSGTAIFAGDFLVGVVVLTAKAADGLLYGCEIAGLFEDQEFRQALEDGSFSVPATAALPTALGEASSRFSKLAVYPLPKVSEADCYDLLGVSKSEYVDQYHVRGETPPYVPRDIDEELAEMLKNRDFVLLVGPSKAGKTRTAYEVLLKLAPLTPMMVPSRAEDLGTIVEELKSWSGRPSRAVLWLDDIEKFLSKGTLDWRLADITLRELGMQIIATMRSQEFDGLKRRTDEIARDAQRVLERAKVINLVDKMTSEEEQRARETYPDLDLGPGLGSPLFRAKN